MWYVGDSPHPEIISSVCSRARCLCRQGRCKRVKVRIASADSGCGSDRRLPLGVSPLALLRGGEAIIRDRYRLGHLSVVLHVDYVHVGWLNVQSGHGKCPIPSDVSHASCDRAA